MTTPPIARTITSARRALRLLCSDSGVQHADLAALHEATTCAQEQHRYPLAHMLRGVITAHDSGTRRATKAAALEALRALRGWEHERAIQEDRDLARIVKSGADWAATTPEE